MPNIMFNPSSDGRSTTTGLPLLKFVNFTSSSSCVSVVSSDSFSTYVISVLPRTSSLPCIFRLLTGPRIAPKKLTYALPKASERAFSLASISRKFCALIRISSIIFSIFVKSRLPWILSGLSLLAYIMKFSKSNLLSMIRTGSLAKRIVMPYGTLTR